MAKTYIVSPNYNVRPPPSLKDESSWPAPTVSRPESETLGTATATTSMQDAAPATTGTVAGTLYLGDILRDPLAGELNIINKRKDRLPVPREKLVLPPDIKTGFKETRASLLKGRLGVWSALLTSLGLRVDISVGLERGADDIVSAQELETQEMELDTVDDEYVTASMQVPSVNAYLAGCRDPPPALYMVTGLKIVYGASVKTGSNTSFDASAGAEACGGSLLKLVKFSTSRSGVQEFTGSVPFVLAFRARKILYKRGRWEHTSWHKGASMMSSGDGDLQDLEVKVCGMGADAVPDEEMIDDDEAHVHEEEGEEINWVVTLG